MFQPHKKVHFEKNGQKATILLFKQAIWATMVVNPFWKLEVSLMYECMYALLFLTWNTYLEAQKSVTLELQLNPINHKTCRGSWNLVPMTLGDATHIFLERCLLQHPETRLNILLY